MGDTRYNLLLHSRPVERRILAELHVEPPIVRLMINEDAGRKVPPAARVSFGLNADIARTLMSE